MQNASLASIQFISSIWIKVCLCALQSIEMRGEELRYERFTRRLPHSARPRLKIVTNRETFLTIKFPSSFILFDCLPWHLHGLPYSLHPGKGKCCMWPVNKEGMYFSKLDSVACNWFNLNDPGSYTPGCHSFWIPIDWPYATLDPLDWI